MKKFKPVAALFAVAASGSALLVCQHMTQAGDTSPGGEPVAVVSQGTTQPVTIKKVSPDDGLTLGNGVSLDRIAPAYPSPFKAVTKVKREFSPNPVAKIRMVLCSTASAVEEAAGFNMQAKARYLFVSAEAKAESERRNTITADTFRLTVIAEADFGHDELQEPELKPEAAKMIADGDMDGFAKTYGTHYVLREQRVAKLVLTISVDRWSEATQSKFRGSLQAGASVPFAGGELKMAIVNDLKAASGRKALDVQISSVGGSGIKGFAELLGDMLAKADFETALAGKLTEVLKSYDYANSGIGSATLASYREFGWNPNKLNLWNQHLEDQLQACAERYYSARETERLIAKLQPTAPEALKPKLGALATAYDHYLKDLATRQQGLLNKDDAAARREMPKEPAVDAATAKLLFGELHTLHQEHAKTREEVKKLYEAVETKRGVKNLQWLTINTTVLSKSREAELPPPEQRGHVVLVSGDDIQHLDLSALIPPGKEVVLAFQSPWNHDDFAREFEVLAVGTDAGGSKLTLSVRKGRKGGGLTGFASCILVRDK